MNYVEKESEKKVEQLCNCVQNYNVTYYYTDVHKLCEAKKKIFFEATEQFEKFVDNYNVNCKTKHSNRKMNLF